jgi:hypothetical protein
MLTLIYLLRRAKHKQEISKMTKRPLSTLSDSELKHAVDRTWRKHSAYVDEQNRRRRIERYGTSAPDLKSYDVLASIGSIAVSVKAQSEEDAEEIVRDALYLGYENRDQIVFDDWNGVEIDNVRESQLKAADREHHSVEYRLYLLGRFRQGRGALPSSASAPPTVLIR